MLKPMLQQWLDDNLPGIVQTAVEAEVERIARSRVR
jgi:cell pole-organizing protein PopZ